MPQAAWRASNTTEWACSYRREAEHRASFGRKAKKSAGDNLPRSCSTCAYTHAAAHAQSSR